MKMATILRQFVGWIVCVVVLGASATICLGAAQTTYTPTMSDYCVQPPFLSGLVPPQVLFTMGKDHKLYLPAYNDASDIDGDGIIETTYKHAFNYYGYFDSNKCYSYASSVFTPYGITSDKYCSTTNCTNSAGTSIDCSGKFSGNFLNWATMSRSDIVKMVIYGGFRTSDNNGSNYAEISGEWIPQDGHIWGKEYVGTDANKLFPGGVSSTTTRALFCVNGTSSGSNNISQLKIIPDVTQVSGVTVTGGLRAWHWINVNGNANICSDNMIDKNGDGTAESATLTGLAKYNVTAHVCDPANGYNYIGDWEKKHCKNYSTASPQDTNGPWRPVGLMQIYGETPNSVKVCSKDMSTTCTNDNNCTGNGQCLNASNMFFGLIMGTYQNPRAGGVLRKAIYSINEETNQSNGILQTSASSGKGLLMKSIEALVAQTTYPLVTHVGNPIAEIMYEGLRYWAGKTTATSAFMSNISANGGTNADAGNYISVAPWDAPASLYPSCSIPFNLVFSDVYNSFDHDQVPGSAFNSFTGDLTGLNVSTLADTIWANESLGTSIVTGESGTTAGVNTDGTCSVKTVAGLSTVKGLCPAEPTMSGSYYSAAVALYGHNYMKSNMGTPNVLTYVVAFPSNVPSVTVYTGTGKAALIAPYAKSVSTGSWTTNGNTVSWNCTTSNTQMRVSDFTDDATTPVTTKNLKFTPIDSTSSCPTMVPTSFYLTESEYNASNQLRYAKFVVASDDLGGGDYDLDMLVQYTVCAAGAANAACSGLTGDQVSVKVERVYSAAGNMAAMGYTIDNVGTKSGSYLVVEHAKPASGSYPANMGDSPGSPLWTNSSGTVTHLVNGCGTGTSNCTGIPTLTYTAASSTVVLPKPPLWYAAKYGGFKDTDGTGLPYTDATCSLPLTDAGRNPRCNQWSSKVPGVPDTYFEVSNPSQMEQRLRDALDAILARVSSGTAASILNNSEGSGASLLQAVFYPKKDFDNNTDAYWVGELHNMWYYLDPYLQNTSIREDTNQDYKLDLTQDKIAQFYFDASQNKTLVRLFSDSNGDGIIDSATPDQTVDPDYVKSLWKAGRKLWARTLTSTPRLLYTHTDITSTGFDDSTTKLTYFGWNASGTNISATLMGNTTFQSLIQTTDSTKGGKLISWTHGTDQTADADGTQYRARKVTINACNAAGSGCQTTDGNYTREWRLGDIISSTPKIVSNNALNSYNKPTPNGYSDASYDAFTKTSTYAHRGMVFVGSNSGMLHAFRLGVLQENQGKFLKAQFNDSNGNLATASTDLGREEWSFIPKQALPYLKYIEDPGYCHLYTVDKTSTVIDASIAKPTGCGASVNYWDCVKPTTVATAADSSWRTIIIGGMGTGGAAKWNGNGTYTAPTDSVKTPVKGTSATSGAVGYSSYFALDVTDPTAPKYLWEFPGTTSAAGNMGFATTGPAIVRIAAKNGTTSDNSKNGRWFAVFASGPTGPIDTVARTFKGQSDQQLQIYVVDLADGTLVRTITQYKDSTGTMVSLPSNAFGGSLATSWIDTDRATSYANGWYSDNAIYIGFTKKNTSTNTWNQGGIIRLTTKEDTDPNNWVASMLIDNIGPVTSSVTKLQDRRNNNLWIYAGTGRFFLKNDDSTTQQALYGIKEPCYSTSDRGGRYYTLYNVVGGTTNTLDPNCYDPSPSGLIDQSGTATTAPTLALNVKDPGWYINLDLGAGGSQAERMITDPVASPSGAVFFTTFKPSNDVCKFGGDSLIWAVKYDSGGIPPNRAMQGKALIQVSTGAFAEISLKSAFSNPGNARLDGRRIGAPISGVPPTAQGLSLITNPPPVKKFLHVREK